MPARKIVTPEQVAQAVTLIKAGTGRNEVARLVGIGRGTVSKIAQDHGLDGKFDRTPTAVATQAKVVDAAARRAQLELDYLDDAERLRQLVFSRHTYRELGSFQEFSDGKPSGSKYSEFVEYTQATPTPADQLKLMQASTLAANSSQRIADAKGAPGLEEAKSLLGSLTHSLAVEWRRMQDDQPSQEQQP